LGDEAAWQIREWPAWLDGYDDRYSSSGNEWTGARSEIEIANLPEKVEPVAIDDGAIVKSPPVVAHGYLDPDGRTADDMHENTSS